jgi:hypothetical protein
MRYLSEEQATHYRRQAARHREDAERLVVAGLLTPAREARAIALAQERLAHALETGRMPRPWGLE